MVSVFIGSLSYGKQRHRFSVLCLTIFIGPLSYGKRIHILCFNCLVSLLFLDVNIIRVCTLLLFGCHIVVFEYYMDLDSSRLCTSCCDHSIMLDIDSSRLCTRLFCF